VSVLPPGVDPAEPCAEVLLYRENAADLEDGVVSYGDGQVIRRVFPTTVIR
jgi:hypothetical protein